MNTITRKPRKPKPHQTTALAAIVPALKKMPRATAVLACGTGKTLLGYWVIQQLRARKTLVLVPSLALMSQTLKEWLRESKLSYLCVCSDKAVEKAAKEDSIKFTADEFGNVTTDRKVVREFLKKNKTGIIFTTYQSAKVVADGAKGLSSANQFDLGIFDESHRTTGRRVTGGEAALFTYALEDNRLPIRRRLFMTATPRNYRGKANKVYSMDQESVYGKNVYTLSFAEAMRRGLIAPLKTIVSAIEQKAVKQQAAYGDVLVGGKTLKASDVANCLAIKQAIEKYGLKKIVTFHSTVDNAADFSVGVRRHLPRGWKVFHVHGGMDGNERTRILTEFETAPRALITNAQCLTEGVDVRGIDTVVFCAGKSSRIAIAQAASRGLRLFDGKKHGHVLFPIYMEKRGKKGQSSLKAAISGSRFDSMGETIRALVELDEAFVEMAKEMAARIGAGQKLTKTEINKVLGAAKVVVSGTSLKLDVLRKAITVRVLEMVTDGWDTMYGKLVAYRKKKGDCNVPQSYKADPSLGKWVNTQRIAYGMKTLYQDRVRRLEKIGFVWDLHQAQWDKRIAELKAHYAKHGRGARVSRATPLGRWISSVRLAKKGLGKMKLTPERIAELDAMGFVWSINSSDPNRCPHGHVGQCVTRTRKDGHTYRECLQCARERVARHQAAKKASVKVQLKAA